MSAISFLLSLNRIFARRLDSVEEFHFYLCPMCRNTCSLVSICPGSGNDEAGAITSGLAVLASPEKPRLVRDQVPPESSMRMATTDLLTFLINSRISGYPATIGCVC